QAVFPITFKTAKASLLTTLLISLPVVLFPQQILYPLLGKTDMSLIADAQPIFYVLLGILITFSIGGVFFNGVAGTGATWFGLKLQSLAVVFYLVYVFLVVEVFKMSLAWAWAAEILYWGFILAVMVFYLKKGQWHQLRL
ncbi:MAG TPA: MATE family efflux transporter, partial [Saprospiraceae bacterium]|nr:MATE family efflux transporter [Saprospiraceae bacterium]